MKRLNSGVLKKIVRSVIDLKINNKKILVQINFHQRTQYCFIQKRILNQSNQAPKLYLQLICSYQNQELLTRTS